MIELSVHNLNKYYGANQIFKDICFDIKTGERVGLVGQNGSGKTTIMKILMGLEDYQGGEITLRKNARIGYLNQIPVYGDEVLTKEVLHMAFEHLYSIKKQMKELETAFACLEGEALEKALGSYGRLSEQYEIEGGYETETRINKTVEGLVISNSMLELPFNQLSGGEKTRVILAKILLEEPDILLLDEPSNHLDLVAIEWLEHFLEDYKGSVLIISHDRYFLDAVVGKIVELEFDHINLYLGNYSYYVLEKERRFLIDYKNYLNEQRKIDRIERQIERYRIWGDSRDSEVMYKRAKELEKRLEKMDTPKKPILEKRKIRLDQKMAGRTGKMVLEVKELSKSFNEKELLKAVEFSILYQDSACIIGKNGSGKTTLLKLILGEVEPEGGSIRLGAQVSIGYLPQHVEYEDEEQTVVDYFSRLHNITTGAARSQLAKVLFLKEDVNKKIKFLSGGEKSRLKLCSLTFEGVNFLILDEPTNHLDIDSREVLEETLMNFEGSLLFVSHDRYFINKVADKILTIENTGLKVYDGDYNYYQEEYQKEAAKGNGTVVTEQRPQGNRKDYGKEKETQSRKKSDLSKNYVQQVTGKATRKALQLEQEIDELEEQKRSLEEAMERNGSDATRLKELFDELEQLERRIEAAYEEWEDCQADIV